MWINLTFTRLLFFKPLVQIMLLINQIRINTYAQLLEKYHYVKYVENYVRINPLRKVYPRNNASPEHVFAYAKLKREWESKLPVQENMDTIISQFLSILSKNKVKSEHQPRNRKISFWDKNNNGWKYIEYFPSGWVKSRNYNTDFDVEFKPSDVFDLIHRLERFRILEFKLHLPPK